MPHVVPGLLIDSLTIVVIDLLLAGDNALVIAMAVRSLPPPQRRVGVTLGALGAVILRIVITIVAAQFLTISYVKLIGGLFVIWIAVKVFSDASKPESATVDPKQFLRTVWYIVVADLTMSADNVLAVAGASKGSIPLIIFGLCVSIPFVIFSSNLLSILMDRYPVIMYLGAAILGKVGGEMIMTDPAVTQVLEPSRVFLYCAEAAAAIGILVAGRLLSRQLK